MILTTVRYMTSSARYVYYCPGGFDLVSARPSLRGVAVPVHFSALQAPGHVSPYITTAAPCTPPHGAYTVEDPLGMGFEQENPA